MGSSYLTPSGFSSRIVFTASQYYILLSHCLPAHNLHRFKTGDIKLSIWLEHIIDGERKKVSAFESIVTVVEPELSIFDFKLYVTLPSIRPGKYLLQSDTQSEHICDGSCDLGWPWLCRIPLFRPSIQTEKDSAHLCTRKHCYRNWSWGVPGGMDSGAPLAQGQGSENRRRSQLRGRAKLAKWG